MNVTALLVPGDMSHVSLKGKRDCWIQAHGHRHDLRVLAALGVSVVPCGAVAVQSPFRDWGGRGR